MIGIKNDNIQMYTEVSCLLEYFPEEYLKKLPEKLKDLINNNRDERYIIDIDTNKSIDNQNIIKKTRNMLAVLKYNYWSTEEEKVYFRKRFAENEKSFQEELREKYNPENIFKKSTINIEKEQNNSIQLVEYKESFLKKIINKILVIFKIR